MGIIFAFIATMLTILLGLGFTGLSQRLTLFRGAGVDGPNTRVTLRTPDSWEVMVLDREGLLPWPSEVIDSTLHFQPLPWPSSLWPEPFVTRSASELAQQRSDSKAQTRHTAPKHAPMQDNHPRHETPKKAKRTKQKRPAAPEADFFDAPTDLGAPDPAEVVESQGITPDMVRSWVGMYGLAGAVERYRKTTGREFSIAAKEIAEILRK